MNKRIILGLGSVAAVVAIGGAVLFSGAAFSQHSDVLYMTDGPTYNDVTDLTNGSGAVAHVRILSAGASYTIPFDKASAVVSARPTGNAEKDSRGPQTSNIPATTTPRGLLKTDFTVEVLDRVHGAGVSKGERIIVSQIGGTVASQRPDGVSVNVSVANAEHDPLMQVGDEELLFLNQDKASGKFFTTGGGSGRFKVQTNGTLTAINHESPIARLVEGKPTSFLTKAVQAVN